MTAVKTWWMGLSDREHWLLGALGATVVLLALVQFALMPLLAWRAEQYRLLDLVRRDAQLVQSAAAAAQKLKGLNTGPARTSETPLRQAVGSSANALGLAISRIQPDGQTGLTIWVEAITAPVFFRWCHELYEHYGIRATRVSLQSEGDQGLVRVQLSLQAEGQS